MIVKLVLSTWEENTDWECFRTGCWEEYLQL